MNKCTSEARRMVLDAIRKTQANPLTTQQLFKMLTRDAIPAPPPRRFNTPPGPPFPNHPITSMRYMKTVVLEDLEARDMVQKIRTRSPPSTPEDAEALAKKIERTNRMNIKKQILGKNPLPPPTMMDTWVWRLTTQQLLADELAKVSKPKDPEKV